MKNNFIFIMCVVLASVTVFISVYVFAIIQEHFRIDSEIEYNTYILQHAPTDTLKIRARTELEVMLYACTCDPEQIYNIIDILEKNK